MRDNAKDILRTPSTNTAGKYSFPFLPPGSYTLTVSHAGMQTTLGLQFFNFFNHANFGFPDNNIADQAFGRISYTESPPTGILGSGLVGDASPRNIQLKAELQF